MIKDTYCSYCGNKFIDLEYPKKCTCGNITWNNPVSVIAVCYRVISNDKICLLIQRRNINPCKGGWALPGGYIDYGETWQEAAVRELYEETGVLTDKKDYELLSIDKSANNNLVIFANYIGKIIDAKDILFIPNKEVSEIKFISSINEQEICFFTHENTIANYF